MEFSTVEGVTAAKQRTNNLSMAEINGGARIKGKFSNEFANSQFESSLLFHFAPLLPLLSYIISIHLTAVKRNEKLS